MKTTMMGKKMTTKMVKKTVKGWWQGWRRRQWRRKQQGGGARLLVWLGAHVSWKGAWSLACVKTNGRGLPWRGINYAENLAKVEKVTLDKENRGTTCSGALSEHLSILKQVSRVSKQHCITGCCRGPLFFFILIVDMMPLSGVISLDLRIESFHS